jgi:predicted anti-sigma-YlaC factor YlaD
MPAPHSQTELIPYLHDELDPRARSRVEAHLAECPECRAEADTLGHTLELIAGQINDLPTPDWIAFRRELRQKLAAREDPPGWWRPAVIIRWGSVAGATIAAIVLLTVVAIHRGRRAAPGFQSPIGPLALADPDADVLGRTDIGLLRNYPMVERLDMLDNDNYDVIEHLDEIVPASQPDEIKHL